MSLSIIFISMNKTSPIWSISKEEFQKICKTYTTLADIIRHFNIKPDGNYKTLQKRIKDENIDISHIKLGNDSNKNRKFFIKYTSKEDVINAINTKKIKGNSSVRRQIIKWNILSNKECSVCHIKNNWNGKILILQLDHIDGNHQNHNISNLRFICPNCHSQTKTFSGKNKMVSVEGI